VNETARRIAPLNLCAPKFTILGDCFDVDEQLVSARTEAARHLLRAADAPLPNGVAVIEQRGHEIRGGDLPLPPRKRAQGGG